jgi:hypothetical protein
MKTTLCRLLLAACGAIAAACSNSLTGGSGTETTTGYAAAVIYPDGTHASAVKVRVRTADYFRGFSSPSAPGGLDTITDAEGVFFLNVKGPAEYVIEVNDGKGFATAKRCAAGAVNAFENLGTLTLRRCASLAGTVALPAGAVREGIGIRGLERLAVAGVDGRFALSDLPAGRWEARAYADSAGNADAVVDNVKLFPAESLFVALPAGYRFSRFVFLNTAAGGADVKGDVRGFPLLIRLNAGNFDFAAAADDGRDLRFQKPGGGMFPREIERFNKEENIADVWVKTDTIRGGDSTQAILLSWENPGASLVSDGGAVFDSTTGFEAVYHLSDRAIGPALDAGQKAHTGVYAGATDTAGVIGNARAFHGGDSVAIEGLLGAPHKGTLSAWARLTATDSGSYSILSIGGYCYLRLDFAPGGYTATGLCHVRDDSLPYKLWSMASAPLIRAADWHYCTFTLDSSNRTQSVTVDDNPAAVFKAPDSVYYSGLRSATSIGGIAIGDHQHRFIGAIDEVRVSRLVRSADWNLLCYMNQRPDDKLVVYR